MYINTHIHTPFSFSSFDSVEQAVKLAKEEGVGVLGINDFNTVEGHGPFAEYCSRYGIYPLFNIEFATLIEEDCSAGLKWNDSTYPGIMYLCGKALDFPVSFNADSKNLIGTVWKVSQDRIWKMIALVNRHLDSCSLDIVLDYNKVRLQYAKHAVLERHLARALYMAFVEKWNDPNILLDKFRVLFADESFNADMSDAVAMQNEILYRLFKPGKVGYIENNYANHVRFYEARTLILSAGGIPCYPMLLDSSKELTDKEKNIDLLINELIGLDIWAVEFISNRVNFETIKRYAQKFYDKGFCVTFGTEHCTLERYSLIPGAAGGRPLDEELEQIGYEGVCVYAAHQQMHHQNNPGFIDDMGKRLIHPARLRDFIRIGDEVINSAVKNVDSHIVRWY